MKQVQIHSSTAHLDYAAASALAASCAADDPEMEAPVVVAWHDKRLARMSPVIAGADIATRWHDYGASHCGCLEVDIDGQYAFIFSDSAAFDPHGPSPYVNLSDDGGNEYLCQANALRDPHRPDNNACVALDDYTSKMT